MKTSYNQLEKVEHLKKKRAILRNHEVGRDWFEREGNQL